MCVGPVYLLSRFISRKRGLKNASEKRGFVTPSKDGRRCVWIHAVSVGEVGIAVPLVKGIKAQFPDIDIRISVTTDTGYEVAVKRFGAESVMRFPMDFSWMVKRALNFVKPEMVVLIELEVWPNFLAQCKKRDIPVVVVNGRVSDRAFLRYEKLGSISRGWFSAVQWCGAQTEDYAQRFKALGVVHNQIEVTGNIKFDALKFEINTGDIEALKKQLSIDKNDCVILGGCTHKDEEEAILKAVKEIGNPSLRLILCPRHPERLNDVCEIVKTYNLHPVLKSIADAGEVIAFDENRDTVLIIDTMGELAMLYGLCDVAFVGGSLIPHGGQNLMEPAALGKPVIVGQHTKNFAQEVECLNAVNGVVVIEDSSKLPKALEKCLGEEGKEIGQRAHDVLIKRAGATKRTLSLLKKIIN